MPRIVLLIEDDPGHQEAITKFVLENLGYSVEPCTTLDELINAVHNMVQPCQGIVLDFRVPRAAGTGAELEAGRDCGLFVRGLLRGHLSETPLLQHVPIVAYTEHEDPRILGWKDVIKIHEVLVKRQQGIGDIEATIKSVFGPP